MTEQATKTDTRQQEEKLRAEMRQDAERKAKRLIDRARRDGKKLVDGARKDVAEHRRARLAIANHHAAERVRAVLAGVEHEKRRRELVARESVIEQVLAEALKRARELLGSARLEALRELAREGVEAIGLRQGTFRCRPADKELVDRIARQMSVEVQVETTDDMAEGIVVVDGDGRRSYDNTFTARLERMREQLRALAYRTLKAKTAN